MTPPTDQSISHLDKNNLSFPKQTNLSQHFDQLSISNETKDVHSLSTSSTKSSTLEKTSSRPVRKTKPPLRLIETIEGRKCPDPRHNQKALMAHITKPTTYKEASQSPNSIL